MIIVWAVTTKLLEYTMSNSQILNWLTPGKQHEMNIWIHISDLGAFVGTDWSVLGQKGRRRARE